MFSAESFPAQGAGVVGRRAENLVEVFRRRAIADAGRTAFTFLPHAEDDAPQHHSYAQLDERARAMAAHLQTICQPGDRALLMYDTGLEYIAALAGCLYAGVVAVPVFAPDPTRVARTLPRLEAIVADAEARILLGTSSDLAWAGAMLGQVPGLGQLIPSDSIDLSLGERFVPTKLDRSTPAFLQYTSGSTGTPKGVLVTHGNLLANLAQMEQAIDIPDAIVCTWLPAYHDMGLVGGIFQCWYSGRHNILMSPLSFFQQPLRWLRAIAEYRATTIAAPDFAYDLCVRKIKPEERQGLDLSCLQVALSGAEPVRAATIDSFVAAFAECGVRQEIFRPCYGMAEATLFISAARRGAGPMVRNYDSQQLALGRAVAADQTVESATRLVGCGRTATDARVAIIDPSTGYELPAGQVGEIWVSGANVASQYWRQPDLSLATFHARTATGDGPFLRTGDLGFLDDGELFISGRWKDLIIVNGRNYYPQDIEQSIEACHPAIKPRGAAAFSIDGDGRERLIIVQEIARPKKCDLAEVTQAIRRAVREGHDLAVDGVVLVRVGTIPKTTSGKLQRRQSRELYLRGELETLERWDAAAAVATRDNYVEPRSELEAQLAQVWAEVLGVERVGVFDSFLDLGGSSLLATQMISRLAPLCGAEIPLSELFDRPNIAALADLINARHNAQQTADAALLAYVDSLTDDEAVALLAKNDEPQLVPSRMIWATAQTANANYSPLSTSTSGGTLSHSADA